MGKTRLVAEVLAGAEDFRVLTAECGHSGASAPYATVRLLLAAALGLSAALRPAGGSAEGGHPGRGRATRTSSRSCPMLGLVFDVPLDRPKPFPPPSRDDQPARLAPHPARSWARSSAPTRCTAWWWRSWRPPCRSPTLLVVEDAHLMDGDSARVLEQLAGRCDDLPWLLLTTRRALEDESHRRPGRRAGAAGCRRASEQMTELVDPDHPLAPAAAKALVARAGGHPLFLRELVLAASAASGSTTSPCPSRSSWRCRSTRLRPASGRCCGARRCWGTRSPSRSWGSWWQTASRADLRDDVAASSRHSSSRTGARRWQFRHAVHRETAYAGLPMKVRTRLHATVGEVLARSARTRARRPEVLAHHFFAAGRYADAWQCARLAGVKALAAAAPEAAAHAYAQAAEAALRSGSVPTAERAADLESWGDALFLCGRSGDADRAYAQARRLWVGVPVRSAALALKAAKVAQRQGRHPVALRRTATGLRHPRRSAGRRRVGGPGSAALPQERGADEPGTLRGRGALRARRGRARRAGGPGRRAGAGPPRAARRGGLHRLQLRRGPRRAPPSPVLGSRRPERPGPRPQQHRDAAAAPGPWTESLEGFQRAAASFEKVGDAANAANAAYNSADLLNRQGRPQEALDVLAGVLRIAKAVDDEELRALVLREQGRAHHRAGAPRRAGGSSTEARALFHALHEPHEVCETDIAVAEGTCSPGRAAEALEAAQRALATITRLRAATLLPSALRVRASAQAVLGDLPGAWASLREGLAASAAPDLAHERGFLLAVAGPPRRRVDLAGHEASRRTRPVGRGQGAPTVAAGPPVTGSCPGCRR